MDKNLVDLWSDPLSDKWSIRGAMRERIGSNDSIYDYPSRARTRERQWRKKGNTYKCPNAKTISTFLQVHKDKPAFRPTTREDFIIFNDLSGVPDRIRGKFMPVLSGEQERELGWVWLAPVLNDTVCSKKEYINYPTGMHLLHHAHISLDDPKLVAYYPSLKHLTESMYAGDPNLRAVKTTLGKYLTAYREALNLTEVDVKDIVESYNAHLTAKVGWAVAFIEHDDPEGWVKVYGSGVGWGSCMTSQSACVRVYAHEKSVLRLAYVVDPSGDVVARCIVRGGEGKGYIRMYGVSESARVWLRDYLIGNGYPDQTSLDGCLLQAIERKGGGYVCPYIDTGYEGYAECDPYVVHDKLYLLLGEGSYMCDSTDGYCDEMCECDCCGGRAPERNMTSVYGGERTVCGGCLYDLYIQVHTRGGYEYVLESDNPTWHYDGEAYIEEGLEYHNLSVCEYSDRVYPADEMVAVRGEGWVHSQYATEVDHMEDCHDTRYVPNDHVATLSDGTTCHKDDVDYYEAEIDEATPRVFVIPASATAVQLYAHN